MKKEDLAQLAQPYPNDGRSADEHFSDAVGVSLPKVSALAAQVFDDLDEKEGGIGWWAPHPGKSRRILISDYLYQATDSVETNLIEAKLHLLETVHAEDLESAYLSQGIRVPRAGEPPFKHPPRTCATDDLAHRWFPLHVAGTLRAVGAALDCLGSSIVGVLGLPQDILRGDLDKARKALKALATRPSLSPGEQIQLTFGQAVEGFERQAGPEGWLQWTNDLRNMYVHRGRRLQPGSLNPDKPIVVDPTRTKILSGSLRVRARLPQDPAWSEIDVLRESPTRPFVLNEDAVASLQGLLKSAQQFVEDVATAMLDVWGQRRSQPGLIVQPREQWKDITVKRSAFVGFNPGQARFGSPDTSIANPSRLFRMKVGFVTKELLPEWAKFD